MFDVKQLRVLRVGCGARLVLGRRRRPLLHAARHLAADRGAREARGHHARGSRQPRREPHGRRAHAGRARRGRSSPGSPPPRPSSRRSPAFAAAACGCRRSRAPGRPLLPPAVALFNEPPSRGGARTSSSRSPRRRCRCCAPPSSRSRSCSSSATSTQPEFERLYEGIELRHLIDDPMYLALPRDHPAARKPRVRLQDVSDDVWIQRRHDRPVRTASTSRPAAPRASSRRSASSRTTTTSSRA